MSSLTDDMLLPPANYLSSLAIGWSFLAPGRCGQWRRLQDCVVAVVVSLAHGTRRSALPSAEFIRARMFSCVLWYVSCTVPASSYRIRLYTSEHERETKFRGVRVRTVGGSLPQGERSGFAHPLAYGLAHVFG